VLPYAGFVFIDDDDDPLEALKFEPVDALILVHLSAFHVVVVAH
jgi:hypothetical protein